MRQAQGAHHCSNIVNSFLTALVRSCVGQFPPAPPLHPPPAFCCKCSLLLLLLLLLPPPAALFGMSDYFVLLLQLLLQDEVALPCEKAQWGRVRRTTG